MLRALVNAMVALEKLSDIFSPVFTILAMFSRSSFTLANFSEAFCNLPSTTSSVFFVSSTSSPITLMLSCLASSKSAFSFLRSLVDKKAVDTAFCTSVNTSVSLSVTSASVEVPCATK